MTETAAPIRVLYVIDKLIGGGAEHHVYDVVSGLDRKRFSPLICCLGIHTPLLDQLASCGVPVRALGLANIWGAPARRMFRPLVRWIRESRVDLVHTYLSSSNVYGTLAARAAGVSTVIGSRRDLGFSTSWRMSLLEQLVINPQVQRVIAVSDAVGQKTAREWFLPPEKIRTIPNGLDLERVDRQRARSIADIRAELCVRPEQRVFTLTATLKPVKAPQTFLHAAKRVLDAGQDAVFVSMGSGALRDACERLVSEIGISDRVRFLGRCERERTIEVVRASDVGVLCSDTEGMSNALLEFMACSKPVVATRVGGNLEVVADRETGLLVPPRDVAALGAAMLELGRDPMRAAEIGRRGRLRLEARFTRERMLAAMQDLYEEVLRPKLSN